MQPVVVLVVDRSVNSLTWCLQLMFCMCTHAFLLQRISPYSPGAPQTTRVEDLPAVQCVAGVVLEKIHNLSGERLGSTSEAGSPGWQAQDLRVPLLPTLLEGPTKANGWPPQNVPFWHIDYFK